MTQKVMIFIKRQIGKLMIGLCLVLFYCVEILIILPISIFLLVSIGKLPDKLIRFNSNFFSTSINDIEKNFDLPITKRF